MALEENLCELCGGEEHPSPDTEDWLGLTCPGTDAPQDKQDAYRAALAEKFAEYWEAEVYRFFSWEEGREERNEAWDHRVRSDGRSKEELPEIAARSEKLATDCNERTVAEVNRQKLEEVFAPFGGFEVDISHLTVPGQVPDRPKMVRTRKEKVSDPSDQLLWTHGDIEVPDE